MIQTIVTVEGMMCPKCEAHVNEAVKNNFQISSVQSNHNKNQTVILSEASLDPAKLKAVIEEEGYSVTGVIEA